MFCEDNEYIKINFAKKEIVNYFFTYLKFVSNKNGETIMKLTP